MQLINYEIMQGIFRLVVGSNVGLLFFFLLLLFYVMGEGARKRIYCTKTLFISLKNQFSNRFLS